MMKTLLLRWQQYRGIYGIIALWLPFFLFWIMTGLYTPVLSVISGNLFLHLDDIFATPFNYHLHAGDSLDQPSIGKYLLWFTVFSCTAMVWGTAIKLLSDLKINAHRKTFSTCLFLAAFWAMCILSWPSLLLFHYIWSMGITPMRLVGIGYILVSISVWVIFMRFFTKKRSLPPEKKEPVFEPAQ